MNLKHKLAYLVSVVWPAGAIPLAPGTMGSLVTLGLLIWFYYANASWLIVFLIIVISFIVSLCSVPLAAEYIYSKYGAKKRYDKDSEDFDYQEIVIDELHGTAVAALPVFIWSLGNGLVELIVAFFLFRIFDILKTWPIRPIDNRLLKSKSKLVKAIGVMIDDTIAGLMSAGIIIAGYYIF